MIKQPQKLFIMAGEKRKFIVVVEDRRPRSGEIVSQPQPLRQFLMHAGLPHEGRVFGPDERNRAAIDVILTLA